MKLKKSWRTALPWVIGAAILIIPLWLSISASNQPGELDDFAICLKDKGATFYGAFWCPHCQKQKAEFGRSARLLPYVECSTPNGSAQLSICEEKKIENYPTWTFADGTRETGELALARLAEKTGCALPDGQ